MTHVKNVEAFEGFVGSCTGFGDKYNPGLPKLRLDALSVLLVNARKALASVHEKKTDYDRVTNEREVFFGAPQIVGDKGGAEGHQQHIAGDH